MKYIRKSIIKYYVDNKKYPKRIILNPQLLLKYRESLTVDNQRLMLLGIEVEAKEEIKDFKLI